jgi:hydrogenase-4 component F
VFGIGIGGPAIFGSLLHVINNGLTKGVLFLSAGNIHRAYESKVSDDVSGAMRRLPLSGAMLLAGYLAGAGSPPFGTFVSEFSVLNGTFTARHFILGGLFVVLVLTAFLGMGVTVLAVVLGEPSKDALETPFRDGIRTGLPIVIFMGLVLMMGLYLPAPLNALLQQAADLLGPPGVAATAVASQT